MNYFRRSVPLLALLLLSVFTACADPIIMSDGNSVFQLDPATSSGMSSWTLTNGGPNIMPQQWIWYGINSGPLQSMDTISSPSVFFDPGAPNFADILYQNAAISAEITLTLTDASPVSMAQQLQWINLTASPINLTVFQYIHFQFSPNSDSLTMSGGNGSTQANFTADQSGGNGSSEVTVTPFSSNAGYYGSQAGVSPTILDALTNPTTSGTFNADNSAVSALGNVETLFEWQTTLAPGNSYSISVLENLSPADVPEPHSSLLIGAGILVLFVRQFVGKRSLQS